jgi:MFS family permease
VRVPVVLRSLRHRNYLLFFSGNLISLIGTWMQSVAQAWLVYRLTGSSLLLGTVTFASQIPIFLFSPFGGAIADRHSRHRIVIATQAASMILASILAALTFAHVIQEWHIIVLAILLGVVNAFDVPARQAFLVEMVGKEDLTNAIALNSSMFNGARVIGPAIAGLLVAGIGEAWCFFANAVSYIAVIAGLLMMQLPPWSRNPPATSTFGHIAEGFRYVLNHAPVRDILGLVGMISLAGMPYTVLMPVFADHILHGGASAMGLLMGTSGVGALAGALLLAARTGLKGLGRWIAVGCVIFGVGLVAFGYSRVLYLSLALMLPVGCSMMVLMASCNTLIQSMVSDHLRGRVMSVYSMMFMGMAPLGALAAGAFANRLGAPFIVAAGGVVCIVTGGIFGYRLREFRPAARRMIQDQSALANAAEQVVQHT